MRLRNLILVFLLAGFAQACKEAAPPARTSPELEVKKEAIYELGPESGSLIWAGKMLGLHTHSGTLSIKSGQLSVVDGSVTSVECTMDMSSITVYNDTTLGGEQDKISFLERHLKSPSFFNVDSFPEAQFKMHSIEKLAGTQNGFQLTGKLTVKGISKDIKILSQLKITDERIDINFPRLIIDRSKWEVKYGSKAFFDNLGDKIISDDIEFSAKLVATRSEA